MQLTYEPARPEDAPVVFGFAKELIETYETDPKLDLDMALAWTKRKIEKRIGEYTRVLRDGQTVAYYRFVPDGDRMELDDLYVLPAWRNMASPYTSTSSQASSGPWPSSSGRAFARRRT